MSESSPASKDVTLAVLAGGMGTRMGMPKAFLAIAGRPILTWLHDHVAWPGPTLLVVAPNLEMPAGADAFGRIVADAVAGNGPLQGVLTALAHATTPLIAITTVDMPRVDRPMLEWLLGELSPDAAGVMCGRGERSDEIEPFPCILRRKSVAIVRGHLAANRRAMHGLARDGTVRVVAAPREWPEDCWLNLNFAEQLARFEQSLRAPSPVQEINR